MAPHIADWFSSASAAHLHPAKLGATFDFVERFCKLSKTATISMFISPVVLFMLTLKFKIDHHREQLSIDQLVRTLTVTPEVTGSILGNTLGIFQRHFQCFPPN
jgi:hypothetical protein